VNCAHFREMLSAEAAPPDAERHAEACAPCALEARLERRIRAELAGWEEAPAPERLAERALARCVVAPLPVRRRWSWAAWATVAPAAAGALALGLWLRAPAPPVPAAQPVPDQVLQALIRAGTRVAHAQARSEDALTRISDRVIQLRGEGL
jgi:hypothetical protein